MPVRILDIETTGIAADAGEIIEIASVDLTRDFGITNARQTLVRPTKPIPPTASAIHHILDEDVATAPLLGEAITRFQSPDLILVAHNAVFERTWLGPLIEAKGWVCTMKAARHLWPDAPSFSNQALRYQLGLVRPFGMERSEIVPHRAISDVIVTAAILAHILEKKLCRFADLLAWTEAPTHYAAIPVGKHRGKRWEEIDGDYLAWVALRSDLEADVKAAAKAELEARKKAA